MEQKLENLQNSITEQETILQMVLISKMYSWKIILTD